MIQWVCGCVYMWVCIGVGVCMYVGMYVCGRVCMRGVFMRMCACGYVWMRACACVLEHVHRRSRLRV